MGKLLVTRADGWSVTDAENFSDKHEEEIIFDDLEMGFFKKINFDKIEEVENKIKEIIALDKELYMFVDYEEIDPSGFFLDKNGHKWFQVATMTELMEILKNRYNYLKRDAGL